MNISLFQSLHCPNHALDYDWRSLHRYALIIDVSGLPETILAPLAILRHQWCAQPTDHGGKSTRLSPSALRKSP